MTQHPNLFLVGFMGTGKSTVGRAVAAKLNYRFIDTDVEIERQAGRSIPQIFAEEGEKSFRRRERALVDEGLPADKCVVACGGGLIVPEGMLPIICGKGVLICLHATVETILRRTALNQTRPLLQVEDPEARIRELHARREAVYRRAGTMVLTDFRTLREVIDHVLRIYRREAREWAGRRRPGAPGGAAR